MQFTRITRPLYSDKVVWPALLPADLAAFVRQNEDLVLEGDSLTLPAFAELIRKTATSGKDFYFASRLCAWYDVILELDSRLVPGAPLPAQLTRQQGGQTVTYCQAMYQRLLGVDALNYLQRGEDQWHPDWAATISEAA